MKNNYSKISYRHFDVNKMDARRRRRSVAEWNKKRRMRHITAYNLLLFSSSFHPSLPFFDCCRCRQKRRLFRAPNQIKNGVFFFFFFNIYFYTKLLPFCLLFCLTSRRRLFFLLLILFFTLRVSPFILPFLRRRLPSASPPSFDVRFQV